MTWTRFKLRVAIAALLLTAVGSPARADFLLGGTGTERAAEADRASGKDAEENGRAPMLALPRFKVAQGFGQDVPLAFAVRQIVPPAVRVRYGRGVNPEQTVTWRGAAPWNHVLSAAVRPLGLKVFTGTTSVLIAR